jgi:hypothetical protein
VVLRSDGVAVAQGSVVIAGSSTATLNGINFTRSAVALGPSGARADFVVRLPTGFGYSSSKTVRLLDSTLTYSNAAVDASLLPTNGTWTPAGGGVRYACEESKPLWIEITGFSWQPSAGTITPLTNGNAQYVRTPELDQMVANGFNYSNNAAAFRRSNEGYFRLVNSVTANTALVRPAANGAALLQLGLGFRAGTISGHYPYGARITIGGGTARISNDLFDPATSSLNVSTPISVPYATNCTTDACAQPAGGAEQSLFFAPSTAPRFTI